MANDTNSEKCVSEAINQVKRLYVASNIRVRRQFKDVYPHIDKIRINCNPKDGYRIEEEEFFSSLRGLWFKSCGRKLSIQDHSYKWIRKYKNLKTKEQLDILHYRLGVETRPQIQIHFNDPKKETLQRLIELCNSMNMQIKFSQIEFTMDFPDDFQLHVFFIDHLFVNNNRGEPRFEGEEGTSGRNDWRIMTYYSGQKNRYGYMPKNCKITTLYRKSTANGMILRLELILNRVKIREFELDVQLKNINTLDISKLFCFKMMDWKTCYKHIENRFLKHRGLSKKSLPMHSLFIRDVLLRGLNDPGLMPLYAHLKKEKRITQPNRFLMDMPGVNKEFFRVLENKQFLS
jgi:hypothetical protein